MVLCIYERFLILYMISIYDFAWMLNLDSNSRAHTHKQNEKSVLYGIRDVQNEFLILYEKIYIRNKFHFVHILVRIMICV